LYGYFASGTYVSVYTNAAGCDSTRTLKLTVRTQAVTRTTTNISICQGDTYEGHTQSGTYINVFKGVNACDSIRTLILTVNALPGTPQVTASGNPGICPGSSLLLTSNSTNGNQWLLNGTPIQGATANTYSATVAGNYSVTISNGCTSTASPSIAITMFTLPPTPAVTAGGPLGFCPSGNVVLSSSAAAGNQWYLNGVAISNAKNQTYTATLAGNYSVRVTDANACTSTASAATTVTIQPAPATPVVTVSGVTSFCPGGSVLLKSSAATANQWLLNGAMIPNATSQTFSANATGNYSVQTSEGSVCASLPSAATTVTVFAAKTQTNDVIICKGSSYFAGGKQQTVSGTYQDVLKTYQGCDSVVTTNLYVAPLPAHFLPPDTAACIGGPYDISLFYPTVNWSTGNTGPTISVTQPGAYSAQVIDKNGCKGGDTINVSFKYCITIQTPDAFTPNNDGKNDVFKPLIGAPVTNYHLQIYNRWGQLVFETRDYTKGWNGNFGGGPEPGGTYVYLISLVDLNGATVVKKGTLVLIR
jgi:gliding motility-associated-like protein